MIPLVWLILWGNSSECIDHILLVNQNSSGDSDIAELIRENANQYPVYMIDDASYRYTYFYSRMQVLLKDIRVEVITPDEADIINDGAYVVGYTSTDPKKNIFADYTFIEKGHVFSLYQK